MTNDASELSAANVHRILAACRAVGETDDSDAVHVEGYSNSFTFQRSALSEHRDALIELVRQIPDTFTFKGAGAETVLKLGERADGTVWTTDEALIEQFCCLAIATGYAAWIGTAAMWSQFKGGKPYVVFGELYAPAALKTLEPA